MADIRKIHIRCLHCKRWFDSGIGFDSGTTFDTSTLIGNLQQCPFCKKMTGCNKKNMKWVSTNGEEGFIGKDTM